MIGLLKAEKKKIVIISWDKIEIKMSSPQTHPSI